MDDGGLIDAVLNLTSLGLGDGLGHVHGDGAGLGVRHEALGAEHAAQTADQTHHIRGGDTNVKSEPAALNLGDHVLSAHEIGASGGRFLGLGALGDHEDGLGFAGAVGQNDGAANLLIGVTGINAQTDGDLDGLVELGLGGLLYQRNGLFGIIQLGTIDQLDAVAIFLSGLHVNILPVVQSALCPPTVLVFLRQSSTITPMERAVPATMLMAASMEAAFRSGILSSAISFT